MGEGVFVVGGVSGWEHPLSRLFSLGGGLESVTSPVAKRFNGSGPKKTYGGMTYGLRGSSVWRPLLFECLVFLVCPHESVQLTTWLKSHLLFFRGAVT